MVQDLATQWIQTYPRKTKTSQETQRTLQKFLEPDRNLKSFTLTIPWNSCEDLSWNHCTSNTTQIGDQWNFAEKTVRRVKEGISAVLFQSGLNENWWADSVECHTYLRNVTDLLSGGKTSYERRFGQPLKGTIIPFGSLVEYYPITAKDQSRIHQFGKKVFPSLFLGYALCAGWIWKGDVLVTDLEELETMDASEICSKRLNAKEVIFPKQREFIFPIADGRIKTPGGDQELRTSTLIRPRPIRGEGHVDFLGEEGSLPQPHDSLPDAGEAINDFWSMSGSFIYRHHVEPRVKLYSPREESFPIRLKYIDVTRTTHTKFGCQAREAHWWLLEHWWVSRLVWSLRGRLNWRHNQAINWLFFENDDWGAELLKKIIQFWFFNFLMFCSLHSCLLSLLPLFVLSCLLLSSVFSSLSLSIFCVSVSVSEMYIGGASSPIFCFPILVNVVITCSTG